jgi:SAM-dependent methyltransferase
VLAERFDQVIGVDISEPLIDIARHRQSGRNVRYDVIDLMAFEDAEKFDLVFSSTTLHHVADLDAALLHLKSLTRGGGKAILIDNVATRPTPGHLVHVLGAVRHFPGDVFRCGWPDARWLLRFRTSAAWLDHLASDRYLSRKQFEQRYGAVFAGGRFANLGYAHGLVWVRGETR